MSETAWTTSAIIVASDSASCVTRRSAPQRLSSFVLISNPSDTARLAIRSAAIPAARDVIQNRWGVRFVCMRPVSGRRRSGSSGAYKPRVGPLQEREQDGEDAAVPTHAGWARLAAGGRGGPIGLAAGLRGELE